MVNCNLQPDPCDFICLIALVHASGISIFFEKILKIPILLLLSGIALCVAAILNHQKHQHEEKHLTGSAIAVIFFAVRAVLPEEE
jgi:hypothetical protein